MHRQMRTTRKARFGIIFAGILLSEIGLLQFFKLQFGVDWPKMWPLFLVAPGLALVCSALSGANQPPDGRSSQG